MIVKERTIPIRIQKNEALLRRIPEIIGKELKLHQISPNVGLVSEANKH
ncbi:hypothetical protein [Cytobacillus solani]|nr:hypothetical protein [Cytobacillus solani]